MAVIGRTTTTYAGFWRRVAAVLIDGILIGIVTAPLNAAVGGYDMYSTDPATASGVTLASTVISWLYFALMESSSRQATLGKMALGIVVTDLDGNRIGFGRATGRYFAKFLSGLILGIGFLMAAFTERKQALHDMIASTLVIHGEAPTGGSTTQPVGTPAPGSPPLPPPPGAG